MMWCFIVFLLSVPPCCCGTDTADFWVGLLFSHYSMSRLPSPSLPNPDELKWTQPLSPSQQLGVTDFKALDMNNQTVIFSFSSSCCWPDFMIFSPSLSISFSLSCCPSPPPSLSLFQYLSASRSLSISSAPCRSLICTRSSSRSRIRERKLTRRTTTDRLWSSAGNNE